MVNRIEPSADVLAHTLLALSDSTRLQLLKMMRTGEKSVGVLSDRLGESQPKTSRHLAYLRNSGLVSALRDGKQIFYSIDGQLGERIIAILDAVLSAVSGVNDDEPPYSGPRPSSQTELLLPAKPAPRPEPPSQDDLPIFLL